MDRPPEPAESGCVSGNALFPDRLVTTGRLQQFRQHAQLVPGLGVVHPLPRVDDRPRRIHQGLRHTSNRRRIRSRARVEGRVVAQRLGDLLGKDVHRYLDDGGSGPAGPDLAEGPPHDIRRSIRARQLLDPLRDVLVVEERVEERVVVVQPSPVSRRQDDDGHRLAVGLGDPPERVLGPRPVLQGEHADLLPRRQPAHRVGHVQPHPLLPHDDGAHVGGGSRLDDRVDRIPDQELDAFTFQDLGDGGGNLHGNPPWAGT